MKAWSRQSGNSSAWAPTSRVRRTTSRRLPSEPSAISAIPSGGRVVIDDLARLLGNPLDRLTDALVLADADRVAHPVLLERHDRLVAPEARVGADEQRAARPQTAQALHELAHESLCAPLALSGSPPHA